MPENGWLRDLLDRIDRRVEETANAIGNLRVEIMGRIDRHEGRIDQLEERHAQRIGERRVAGWIIGIATAAITATIGVVVAKLAG